MSLTNNGWGSICLLALVANDMGERLFAFTKQHRLEQENCLLQLSKNFMGRDCSLPSNTKGGGGLYISTSKK